MMVPSKNVLATDKQWLQRSEDLAVEYADALGQLFPEEASQLGLSKYDSSATPWSLGTESKHLAFLRSWKAKLALRIAGEKDKNYRFDVELLQEYVERQIQGVLLRENAIPFFQGTSLIYKNIFTLVNPQSSQHRKAAAPERFRHYVSDKNNTGSQGVLRAWMEITMRKISENPQRFRVASRPEIEDYLKNSPLYLDSIAEMLKESGCDCDEELKVFRKQVEDYDGFIRQELLAHASKNTVLPRNFYIQNLRENGVEWDPEALMERAQADYAQMLPEFLSLSRQIGEKLGLAPDQRTPFFVSQALRANHIIGAEALLAFSKKAVAYVEGLVQEHKLITLPPWPVTLRLSTPAENAVMPYVHVNTPPPLGQHSQKPEYVFPVTAEGLAMDEDSHYWAAAVSLAAHEARPGHELQFSRLIAEGSRIRAAFGSTSANVEGWAVYVEHLIAPYVDTEARYGALQSILFRTARSFLDPMVQLDQADEKKVMDTLVGELGLAESFASGEYARYSWRMPGQATTYYYGMRALLDIKTALKIKMGDAFREQWFNDSVIGIGPIPYRHCESLLSRS